MGLHKPWHAAHFPRAFISINALRTRRKDFGASEWILDSGAFSAVVKSGGYAPGSVEAYAERIRFFSRFGTLLAAVAQDFMCEPIALERTGCTVPEHQAMTIERYDALRSCDTAGVYVMPVLQGYRPAEYVEHLAQYGERLAPGAWVGVGSVCKRNGHPGAIEAVLLAIHHRRPDLRLHGFGLKKTALASALVRTLLETADSMAWSQNARMNGRNGNDWREAARYVDALERQPLALPLWGSR